MKLRALLLCSDEKIVRVVRRTLGDLDIAIEHCPSGEVAVRQLSRERFEAIIVDCAGPGAADVLRNARAAPCNKRAVAVAILDPSAGVRSAFELGAHFVLYKPVSGERAKSSFRVARTLMKKERRRNERVGVKIPLEMVSQESGARFKVNTTDLGEGGLAVSLPKRSKPAGRWELSFTLPGSKTGLKVVAEFAWEGSGTQVGMRFVELSPESERQLREWLSRNSPDAEKDDPPVRCQLSDLSLGGCYLEVASPFPVSTRVTLSMRAADIELKAEGVVRVMHADKGMGVEFTQTTAEHRALLEKFLSMLSENREMLPELMVEPEGLETEPAAATTTAGESGEANDPLLEMFRKQSSLPPDAFLAELRKKRGVTAAAAGD
ncbi:MAG: PilZ domain-containing protein [Candidatus Sulfotelmatobacter sp.]|jgi:c-di-GMP-binding flagellar brake protein YcgR